MNPGKDETRVCGYMYIYIYIYIYILSYLCSNPFVLYLNFSNNVGSELLASLLFLGDKKKFCRRHFLQIVSHPLERYFCRIVFPHIQATHVLVDEDNLFAKDMFEYDNFHGPRECYIEILEPKRLVRYYLLNQMKEILWMHFLHNSQEHWFPKWVFPKFIYLHWFDRKLQYFGLLVA